MNRSLDGRGLDALRGELLRRAAAVFGDRADAIEPGEVLDAILSVAARIGEEVTRRFDQVPAKQAANFYTAMGLGRAPPVPARMPVAFTLADSETAPVALPAGTRLLAEAGGQPVTFETTEARSLAPGRIVALAAADAAEDEIVVSPPAALAAAVPPPAVLPRRLAGGAGRGAAVLAIDPPIGLLPGAMLRLGAADYAIAKVDGDLITIEPPLEETLPENAEVREVTAFAPFAAGARNVQSHRLYLGHPEFLDLPSETSIAVSGLIGLPASVEWAWHGKPEGADKPDWLPFTTAKLDSLGRWVLRKPKGKPEAAPVDGQASLWLRASLPQNTAGKAFAARSIGLSLAGERDCARDQDGETPIDYEAIAVTTPVVPNKPYYPFGREPRLYDAFHIGCSEIFAKPGAHATLTFELGGAELGPLAMVSDSTSANVFGVGTDGMLYRANLGIQQPSFSALPLPLELHGVGFDPQGAIAARIDGGTIRLAAAAGAEVYVANFAAAAKLAEDGVKWQRLEANHDVAAGPIDALYLLADSEFSVVAHRGTSLLTWPSAISEPTLTPEPGIVALLPLQGSGGKGALVLAEDSAGGKLTISLLGESSTLRGPQIGKEIARADLPVAGLTAWADPQAMRAGHFFLAGYNPEKENKVDKYRLILAELNSGGIAPHPASLFDWPAPVSFEPGFDSAPGGWPIAVLAGADPVRVSVRGGKALSIGEAQTAVPGGNRQRRLTGVGQWSVMHHPDRGLLFRKAADREGRSQTAFPETGKVHAVLPGITEPVPAAAQYLALEAKPSGPGFELVAEAHGPARLLEPLNGESKPVGTGLLFELGTETGDLIPNLATATVTLPHGPAPRDLTILLTSTDTAGALTHGIWRLEHVANDEWQLLNSSPLPPANSTHTYVALEPITQGGQPAKIVLNLRDTARGQTWFEPDSADALFARGDLRPFYAQNKVLTAAALREFGTIKAFAFAKDWLDRQGGSQIARFALAPEPWTALGPSQPANPDLSWEYWNGQSWWSLDAEGFKDETADLQVGGRVSFTVPDNLEPTEVAGRKNHWIRARLIGGDYGEAKVTVKSTEVDGTTEQTVTRDLSAIRAPHVLRLDLDYCMTVVVPPALVLTGDNLGVVDRTSANDAGLLVPVFTPVAAALDGTAPEPPEPAEGEGECCESWRDPVAPEPADDTPPLPAGRFILAGFGRAPAGPAISLFAEAGTTGQSAKLTVQALHAGRFAKVDVLEDATAGLSEAGLIELQFKHEPERATLFGTSAYWLAFSLEKDSENWSPHLLGLHLNGVRAASVETRRNERLGTSSGAPEQTFRLAAAPIDPESLELFVAEPVGREEAKALDALSEIEGMPRSWVPWFAAPELPAGLGPPARRFTIDALNGTITFGDGRNALVPPMGSAILARGYRQVTGLAANGVAAGAILQTISPVAGIEQVIALQAARGGADAESSARALARAPAKLRSGDRPITLADLEEFVLARQPWVAQARAVAEAEGVRLVIAARGPQPVPAPAALRGIGDLVAAAGGIGLTAGEGLRVVAPRIVPVAIAVTLEADHGVDREALRAAACKAIGGLLDHETGGIDGRGWPLGMVPGANHIAAVLGAMTVTGATRDIVVSLTATGTALPATLAFDRLVRAEPGDIAVELAVEREPA